MDLDLSKLFNGATINISINANMDAEAVKMFMQLLGGNSANIKVNTTTEKTAETSERQQTSHSQSKENKSNSEDEKKSDDMFDIAAVCKTIREYAELAKSGEDIKDTSAIMAEEINKMTNGRVHVFLGTIGRYHAILPNFIKTPEVCAMFRKDGKRGGWAGWLQFDKMEDVLSNAFTNQEITEIV